MAVHSFRHDKKVRPHTYMAFGNRLTTREAYASCMVFEAPPSENVREADMSQAHISYELVTWDWNVR